MPKILLTGFLFGLCAIASPGAYGQSSAPPLTEPPAAKPSDNSFAGEAFVFELFETRVRFEADGKGQRDVTIRVRIQSESAVKQFGLLVYPFAASFESLDILSVRVRKPDGTVVETPLSEIQETDSAVSRAAPMYTDQREKHVPVKGLSAGDLLEAHLRWIVHNPIAPGHFWYDDSYFHDGICLSETVEIDVPGNLPITIRSSGPQPSTREENGRRIYTIQTSNLKVPEKSAVSDWEKTFQGMEPPDLRVSSFSSWKEVSDWFASLAQPKAVVTPEVRAKADELLRGKTSEREILQALYDFVSLRFRYIGIDLGLARYTPHAADQVLANRYGDCKDKHTLFAALLQAEGISAYPTLISSKYRIDPSFVSPSLFDHVITAIPSGEGFLFLDTTPEVAPFGLIQSSLRDRLALVAAKTGAGLLVKTPGDPPPPLANRERVQIDSSIDAQGTLDARMRFEERGDVELVLRAVYRSIPPSKWQELTQTLAARMGFAGTVSDVSIAAPEDTSNPFWISFAYHRTEFPDWKNRRILLPSAPIFVQNLNDEQKQSKQPLSLGPTQDVTHETSVSFPKGFVPIAPERISRKADFGEFSANYSVENGVLRGTLRLKTVARQIPGAQRAEFSGFAKAILEAESRYILLRGDFPNVEGVFPVQVIGILPPRPRDSISALEKALPADPDNEDLLVRLSRAYSGDGRAADAVSLLQKAIAAHPGLSGRVHIALAQAYLRLPDGDRAMEEFKKGLGENPKADALNDVAYTLAEAQVHLREALDFSTRSVLSISAETMDISADDLDADNFALMQKLAAYWDTLGWVKFRMGDFAGAEKYLAAAWQLLQIPAIGEHVVEVYEKLGKRARAAAVCSMAMAAGATPEQYAKLSEEMSRLKGFLPPSMNSRTVLSDGSVALSDMRLMKIPFQATLQGSTRMATFVISLINGPKTDRVVFLSGAEQLRNASEALAAFKYPQAFPDGTPTRIIRKVTLSCSIYFKRECTLVLTPVQDAAVSFR